MPYRRGPAGGQRTRGFSPDGNRLASYSGRDESFRIWQISSAGFLGGLLGWEPNCLGLFKILDCEPLRLDKFPTTFGICNALLFYPFA